MPQPQVQPMEIDKAKEQDLSRTLAADGPALFAEAVQAIRTSLQSRLNIVFLIGAGTMPMAFLLILAIPEISIEVEIKYE